MHSGSLDSAYSRTTVPYKARQRYPILKHYVNDWATIEIIKQYIKNKRGRAYKMGWLEVPEAYVYLKQNASKRNPTGSRVKRVKLEMAAKRRLAVHDGNIAEPEVEGSGQD